MPSFSTTPLCRSYSTWSVADHQASTFSSPKRRPPISRRPFAGPPKASRTFHHSAKPLPVSFLTFSSDTTFSDRSVTFIADPP
ncbi:MAG: hypothetical protein IPF66_17910 [Holophagales bacterium]|nr:hypothetical protein [Holophagales bacterium]